MQDSLIGYLLGALSDEQMAQFEAELERNAELREQLQRAAASLNVLRRDADDIEPPSGLAQQTSDFVYASVSHLAKTVRRERSGERDEWTLVDITIAASVVLAACLLFFPAINNSRYHAQIAGCQNNLRSIGQALIEYSSSNAQGLFPQVPESGNLAVAGMYAPTLVADQLAEERNFYCPAASAGKHAEARRIPSVEEINRSVGQKLAELQRQMGGDYGYTLGVMKNGKLHGIRNQSRAQFAIMSDSPDMFRVPGRRRHHGHQNVLFESGGVRTINNQYWYGDQLYRNDHGEVSAGVHESDGVIAGSGTAPVPFVYMIIR